MTKLSSYGGNIDGTTISVSSAANAATALAAIDTAINGLDSQRATYGATINRLQYALDNLSNVSLNTSASRSQVQDADYAKETSELARTQIINKLRLRCFPRRIRCHKLSCNFYNNKSS